LERHPRPGQDTSTHNSGVVHAGLYHPPGSLKARLCVEGKRLLYDFCATHGVPHKQLGKLIVGQTGQLVQLAALAKAARDNNVDDLVPLGKKEIAALEPEIRAEEGLFSPSTGIIDS